MKKCSYCGKEYPDAVQTCPMDGELLAGRKKVTGVWRGVYGYGPLEKHPGLEPVPFTLRLKQGWTSHFTGSVTEDLPQGLPGTGAVDGYFQFPSFEFTKQMPVGYIIKDDGTRMTLREYFIEQGHRCDRELPSPPILYQGTFLGANRLQGTWIMEPVHVRLSPTASVDLPGGAGYWCASFVSEDLKVNSTGGPTEQLFDKSRLSPREILDVEGGQSCSLGKFAAADANRLIDRLAQADVTCSFREDDSATGEMSPGMAATGEMGGTAAMMEIFVRQEDLSRAQAILGEDSPV